MLELLAGGLATGTIAFYMTTDPQKLAATVRTLAKQAGFDLVGITSAKPLEKARENLLQAVQKGFTAQMSYLQRDPEQRANPQALAPWAWGIISLGISYNSLRLDTATNNSKVLISRYALGKDYHLVLKEKLTLLRDSLKKDIGQDFRSKLAVDTSPIMEKPLAQRAGLGWRGKNSLIINGHYGSWIFLGELLTDLELAHDRPAENQCQSCRACIDACPTGALAEPGVVDARKCLSYLTIEHKGDFPQDVLETIRARKTATPPLCVYGCDICQQVCPYNKDAPATTCLAFHPRKELQKMSLADFDTLSESQFQQLVSDTPVARISYQQFRRNLQALRQST